ncbi:MAG: hypothetical protein ACFBZ9_03195 [Sphingomonadales bacterium]
MSLAGYELFAILGFIFAAYSVIANDSIQTLGTFLASNSDRHWTILWLYASSIILIIMAYGYFGNAGDIAFGRLNKIPYPDTGIQWWHALPPLVLLFLTRYGIPVSTTFLVLTIFAMTGGASTEGVLGKMVLKSALGYVVAFGAAAVVYALISRSWERWISKTRGAPLGSMWVVLQWLSTAFLWSQWLMQDLANIFVFLPRETVASAGDVAVTFSPAMLVFATIVIVLVQGYTFATRGGEIQKIVLTKVNTTDIRAATVVDFIYGLILLFFKELNDIPMSTTWVFLGLLAGREMAISIVANLRENREAFFDVSTDVGRAFFGLIVSVVLAFGMPWIATGQIPSF